MTNKLRDNLLRLMKDAHLNAEQLSRRVGLPASTIKKIRNNAECNPTLSTLLPIAKYFSLTVSQLLGDIDWPTDRINARSPTTTTALSSLPIRDWQDCGDLDQKKHYERVSSENNYSADAFALVVQTEEWENLLPGTILLVEPNYKPQHRDYIITKKRNQIEATLKQWLVNDDEVYLKTPTAGFPIQALPKEQQVLGVVVEYKKKLKF